MACHSCITCGEELPFEDFGEGHKFECASCRAADSDDFDDED